MVKPQALWAAFKTSRNSKELGDICRKLGGQVVELSAGAQMAYDIILQDNEWHTESIEAQRERDRKRQAERRERMKLANSENMVSPSVAGAGAATVAPVPKIKPSPVDWSKVNISDDAIMGSPDDAVLMAAKVTGDMNNPKGQGWWRRWIREYPNGEGEVEFRQELLTFKREGCAGESQGRNPASVFTARLKKRFNPDAKKRGGA